MSRNRHVLVEEQCSCLAERQFLPQGANLCYITQLTTFNYNLTGLFDQLSWNTNDHAYKIKIVTLFTLAKF